MNGEALINMIEEEIQNFESESRPVEAFSLNEIVLQENMKGLFTNLE